METQNHTDHCDHEHHGERVIETIHQFSIDENPYYVPRGYYLVKDLKTIGRVSECHILAEIRGSDPDDLTDDTAVHIKGGEVFKSYPGKGKSS